MSNTQIKLIFRVKKILRSYYSNLPLKQKISLPFLSVFLTIWFLGNFSIVYYFSQNIEARQLKEVEGIASLVVQELQRQMNKLYLNAKILVAGTTLKEALETGNKTALQQQLIPLKTSLSLDFVKVIDQNGNKLIDLRSQRLNQAKISDKLAILQVINGVHLSSIITTTNLEPSRSILIGISPIKSNEGIIGGIIIGTTISNELLNQIATETNKYIVAFQHRQIIASSLPAAYQFSWEQLHQRDQNDFKKIKIGDRLYIAKDISIFGLDGTELELTVLSSLTELEEAKQKFAIVISLFSLLGSAIAILVGYTVSNLIGGRIVLVTSATEKLASGDLKMRIPVTHNDEVDKLATGFNLMAQQLEERERKIKLQVQKLEETLAKLLTTEATLAKLSINQAQLVQTEKMSSLGRMVGGIAHELNNPVGFIYGNIDYAVEYVNDLLKVINLYQQEYPESTALITDTLSEIDLEFLVKDLHNLLNSMKSGANRISNIVKSLRTFSRLGESGMKSIDIHENIESTLSVLQHRCRHLEEIGSQSNRQFQIVKEYGKLPLVSCNPGRLNQVFFNIIDNAIDALEDLMAKGGEIKDYQILIKTEVTDANSVKIKIADNGYGMTEELRQKIFDPFFTNKPVGSGTGLGLYISYLIVVEDHQGKLSCISAPEKGTEFVIELPTAQNAKQHLTTDSFGKSPNVL
ncbi:MAG: ATP-binding protein [Microcoleaceae cyanobacterium]